MNTQTHKETQNQKYLHHLQKLKNSRPKDTGCFDSFGGGYYFSTGKEENSTIASRTQGPTMKSNYYTETGRETKKQQFGILDIAPNTLINKRD